MDNALSPFKWSTAKNFLSVSAYFEPYLPQQSAQSLLKLLGELNDLTSKALTEHQERQPPPPPILPKEAQKPTPPPPPPLEPRAQKVAALAQALNNLRNSERPLSSRKLGIYSPIIRAQPQPPQSDHEE